MESHLLKVQELWNFSSKYTEQKQKLYWRTIFWGMGNMFNTNLYLYKIFFHGLTTFHPWMHSLSHWVSHNVSFYVQINNSLYLLTILLKASRKHIAMQAQLKIHKILRSLIKFTITCTNLCNLLEIPFCAWLYTAEHFG